jgi:hypothetical protein
MTEMGQATWRAVRPLALLLLGAATTAILIPPAFAFANWWWSIWLK